MRSPTAPKRLTPEYRAVFDRHIAGFSNLGDVNALRAEVLTHVRCLAANPPGALTLTVPTGGGKTLASLGFGLDHAIAHQLERLIYVIPHMSIVEQTADVFRNVFRKDFGDDAVIEHQSSFDWDGVDNRVQARSLFDAMPVRLVSTTLIEADVDCTLPLRGSWARKALVPRWSLSTTMQRPPTAKCRGRMRRPPKLRHLPTGLP
ncbi:MAG: DEAD/DEAH box helicase family protein [Pseudomonadota bacterium]